MTQYLDPIRATDGAAIYPGAELTVTQAGLPVVIYADPARTVPLENPLTANAAGRYPPIYVPEGTYTASIPDAGIEQEIVVGLLPLAFDQGQPMDDAGQPLPLAHRTFFQADTTELASVYTDEALSIPSDNPLPANEDGEFEPVYFDSAHRLRAQLHEQPGNPAFNPEEGYYARQSYIGGRLVYDHTAFLLAEPPPVYGIDAELQQISGEDGATGYSAFGELGEFGIGAIDAEASTFGPSDEYTFVAIADIFDTAISWITDFDLFVVKASGSPGASAFTSIAINGNTYLTADCADEGAFTNYTATAGTATDGADRLWWWPLLAGLQNNTSYGITVV